MDDPYKDFPKEFPRVWFVAGIWLAAILLVATMLLYTSTRAHAQQQPICAPADLLIKQFGELHKERIVWQGVISIGDQPIEAALLQSPKNTWTFIVIRGDGRACILAAGRDATPIETGKGV